MSHEEKFSQEINLFSQLPKTAQLGLSISTLIKVWVGLAICFLAWTIFPIWTIVLQNQQIDSLKKEEMKTTQTFQTTTQKYPADDQTPLYKTVQNLSAEINEKQNLISDLTEETDTRDFSKYLSLLSEKVPNNLWLTFIHIYPEKSILNLQGRSVEPKAAAELLENLQTAPLLRRYDLKLWEVKKVEKEINIWTFIVDAIPPSTTSEERKDGIESENPNASV